MDPAACGNISFRYQHAAMEIGKNFVRMFSESVRDTGKPPVKPRDSLILCLGGRPLFVFGGMVRSDGEAMPSTIVNFRLALALFRLRLDSVLDLLYLRSFNNRIVLRERERRRDRDLFDVARNLQQAGVSIEASVDQRLPVHGALTPREPDCVLTTPAEAGSTNWEAGALFLADSFEEGLYEWPRLGGTVPE
jgi:hypothetical protein